jgi:hypothetical protein
LPGTVMIVINFTLLAFVLINEWKSKLIGKNLLFWFSIISISLFLIAFLRIPQKSAFIIPLLPWLYLLFWKYLSEKLLKLFVAVLVLSCFLFGINLNNSVRGNKPSAIAVNFNAGNNAVSLDVLNGPVLAEKQKRINKMLFAKNVADTLLKLPGNTLLIAGWHQNEIVYFAGADESESWKIVYYVDEDVLKAYSKNNYKIYFLPEQDFYNDLRFQKHFTGKYAVAF